MRLPQASQLTFPRFIMHVDRLQGIQVQLDNTWGIIVGLYILQKHKCPYGTGELRFVHLQYSRPSCDTTYMYMPWNIFTTQFHSFLLWVVYSFHTFPCLLLKCKRYSCRRLKEGVCFFFQRESPSQPVSASITDAGQFCVIKLYAS